MEKYHLLLITLLIFITGIIFASFFLFNDTRPTEPSIALSPYVVFEGTVVSLSFDETGNYSQGSEITNVPNDSAVIRIDKIIETGGSSNYNWTSLGIAEGKKASLSFKYTARPAKIITLVGGTKKSGNTVSHTVVPTKITFENVYFVFRIDGNEKSEKILPGLKIGSKFKTKLWNTYEVKIGEYEVIN